MDECGIETIEPVRTFVQVEKSASAMYLRFIGVSIVAGKTPKTDALSGSSSLSLIRTQVCEERYQMDHKQANE